MKIRMFNWSTRTFQEFLTCDYADKVECSISENFYSVNEEFGRISFPPTYSDAILPQKPSPQEIQEIWVTVAKSASFLIHFPI